MNAQTPVPYPVPEAMLGEARTRLLAVIDSKPGEWWRADEVRRLADLPGTLGSYVLCEMANPEYDDTLELSDRLLLRRRVV